MAYLLDPRYLLDWRAWEPLHRVELPAPQTKGPYNVFGLRFYGPTDSIAVFLRRPDDGYGATGGKASVQLSRERLPEELMFCAPLTFRMTSLHTLPHILDIYEDYSLLEARLVLDEGASLVSANIVCVAERSTLSNAAR